MICGNGRTRSAKSPSSTASLRRAQRPPPARPHEQLIRRGPERLEQIARADQLGRGPAADPDLEREQAVEDQQPEALPGGLEPGREIARPDPDLEHPSGRELPGGDPGADVELLGQLPVGVEQVGVQRDRLGWSPASCGWRGHRNGPGWTTPRSSMDTTQPLWSLSDLPTTTRSLCPLGCVRRTGSRDRW